MRRLSRADRSRTSSGCWNTRPMPWPATSAAFSVERTVSPRRTRPVVGRVNPKMQWSSVLLPAPLGPISPTMAPASKEKLTSVNAWTPPKSTDTFSMARRVISALPYESSRHAPQALRHEHHDHDQQQPEDEARCVLDAAQQLGNDDVERRADDRAADRAQPADHHHAQEGDRQPDIEALRVDVAHQVGEQPAGEGGIEGAESEGRDLVARDMDAERGGGDLAFLDDAQRPAGASAADIPRAPETQDHESQSQIVKARRAQLIAGDGGRGQRKAAAPAREVAP